MGEGGGVASSAARVCRYYDTLASTVINELLLYKLVSK